MTLLRAKLFELELEKQRRWAGYSVPSMAGHAAPTPPFHNMRRQTELHTLPLPCIYICPSCSEISARRKSQVGTGSRSEKIKTYNYKDSRMSGEFD